MSNKHYVNIAISFINFHGFQLEISTAEIDPDVFETCVFILKPADKPASLASLTITNEALARHENAFEAREYHAWLEIQIEAGNYKPVKGLLSHFLEKCLML